MSQSTDAILADKLQKLIAQAQEIEPNIRADINMEQERQLTLKLGKVTHSFTCQADAANLYITSLTPTLTIPSLQKKPPEQLQSLVTALVIDSLVFDIRKDFVSEFPDEFKIESAYWPTITLKIRSDSPRAVNSHRLELGWYNTPGTYSCRLSTAIDSPVSSVPRNLSSTSLSCDYTPGQGAGEITRAIKEELQATQHLSLHATAAAELLAQTIRDANIPGVHAEVSEETPHEVVATISDLSGNSTFRLGMNRKTRSFWVKVDELFLTEPAPLQQLTNIITGLTFEKLTAKTRPTTPADPAQPQEFSTGMDLV